MNAIVNTKLIMEDGIIWDGALTYENGRIVEVGTAESVTIPAGAEIIDAKGLYTAPGLIDIHNHGFSPALFADDPYTCCQHFISQWVRSVFERKRFPLHRVSHGPSACQTFSKVFLQ